VRTAINLYSVRELDAPLTEKLEMVADAGYDGVQFSGGFDDATPEEAAAAVADLGLDVTHPHVGIEELEETTESAVGRFCDAIGAAGAVVPHLGEAHFDTAANVDRTAARLGTLATRLAEDDLDLHYHNHAHEFVDLGEEVAFHRLADRADRLLIELDVGWAAVGGDDPVPLLRDLGSQVTHVHMKDMAVDTEEFREIGDGDVDMPGCAEAAAEVGAEWLIYEHDQPEHPAESLRYGAEYLNDLV
jgi:sugar phosphate isomerase/epimerase